MCSSFIPEIGACPRDDGAACLARDSSAKAARRKRFAMAHPLQKRAP